MKPGPGKFEGCDEETGSADELGWYGMIFHRDHGYIVSEDSQGFFDYARYASKDATQAAFDAIAAEEYQEEESSNA